MVVVPTSDIILLKTPMELDERNTLTFSNATAQFNYFNSLPKIELENATYQRKDNEIRFPTSINTYTYDDLLSYNYCMYKNESYSNKWFYAFITDFIYENDGMTKIKIETDVMQTWKFEINYKRSFIDREHIAKASDIAGANTQPEGLETGDYISTLLQPTITQDIETCCVVGVSAYLPELGTYSVGNPKIPQGLFFIGCLTQVDARNLITLFDAKGVGDAVNCVFVIPKAFFNNWQLNKSITVGSTTLSISYSISVLYDYLNTYTITKTDYLGNEYYPRNKKLLTFPYSYLQVSNHAGQCYNYNWENFNLLDAGTTGINFKLQGTLTIGGSFMLYPVNYNNMLNNNDESIPLAKFPVGSYSNDIYTNWLTQTSVNRAMSFIGNGGSALASGASIAFGNANGVSGVASAFGNIINDLQEKRMKSFIPPQIGGNVNCGDITFTKGLCTFEFKRMSIKNEYAEILDSFFDMFGYKTNKVKIPNLENRSNWNYVKTIGCNITGDIPQKDLQKIKDIFDNGVTLWHNASTFLDYSQANN